MKNLALLFFLIFAAASCRQPVNKKEVCNEIYRTEKDFERMAAEKGIDTAFWFFADTGAVIVRQNDSIIRGKEAIRHYYATSAPRQAKVAWSPEFIEVSDCGTLGYTYGHYVWKVPVSGGDTTIHKGVFHTVWKKQKDSGWKYVWD
jgi:ketosteroid isomerase-like protein